MSKQATICRLLLDYKEVITNQIFTSIQPRLINSNVNQEDQKAILADLKITVDKNFETLVDNVIKTVD